MKYNMRVCSTKIKRKNKEKLNKSLQNNAAKMKIIKAIVNSKFNNRDKKNTITSTRSNINQDQTGQTPILQLMTSTTNTTTDQKEQPYQARNCTEDNQLMSLVAATELNCQKEIATTVINRSATTNNNHHDDYDRSLTQMHDRVKTQTTSITATTSTSSSSSITSTSSSYVLSPLPLGSTSMQAQFITVRNEQSKHSVLRSVPAITVPSAKNISTITNSASSVICVTPSIKDTNLNNDIVLQSEEHTQNLYNCNSRSSSSSSSRRNSDQTTPTKQQINKNTNSSEIKSSPISLEQSVITHNIDINRNYTNTNTSIITTATTTTTTLTTTASTDASQYISVINIGKNFVKCDVVNNEQTIPNKINQESHKNNFQQFIENNNNNNNNNSHNNHNQINNYELTNSVIIPNYNSTAYQQQQLEKQQQEQQEEQQQQQQTLNNFYETEAENLYVTEQILKNQEQQQDHQQQQEKFFNTYNNCVYDLSLHHHQNLITEEQHKALIEQQEQQQPHHQQLSPYPLRFQTHLIDENNSDTYLLNNNRPNNNHIMPSNLSMYATYGSNPHEHHYSHHLQSVSSHIHGHSTITHTPTSIDEVIQDTLKDECMDDHNGSALSYCTLTAVTDPTGLKESYYQQQLLVNEPHFVQQTHHHNNHNQSALLHQHLQANNNNHQQHSGSAAASSCGESPPPSSTLTHSNMGVDLAGNGDMNALQSFTTLTSATNNHRDLYGNLTPEHTSNIYFSSPLSPGLQIR